MPLDREETLKKAEKLLRQGRLDNAIAEYLRVVEDQPRDWNTANTLGDLYARASQPAKAVAQYARIAEHFFQDGFYPRAAAIYKKILKLVPDEESAQLKLADISVRLGLLKDAKTYYGAVAARRRTRGDARGAEEIVLLLGAVDPSDFEARAAAARVRAGEGDEKGAAAQFREIYDGLLEKGREPEALEALREAVRLNAGDIDGRAILAKAAIAAGDPAAARGYLDRETAGGDPALLDALVEVEMGAGAFAAASSLLVEMLAQAPERLNDVLGYAWRMAPTDADAGFAVADAAANRHVAASEFEPAAGVLQTFVGHAPAHIPALLKLVEVCVDGGLETAMYETQAQLTDAYLAASQAAEARVIAEDLVAREPWEPAHIERFRRALVMLRVPEPDSVIAERLSGQTPFVATDHFWEGASSEIAAPAVAAPPPAPPPEPAAAPPDVPAPAPAPREAMEIDLTTMLGDLHGETAPVAAAPPEKETLDEVFGELRGDAARQAPAEQSERLMTIARTYLEMGMADEAVTALKGAARAPQQRFEAGRLLGRFYREQGNLGHAIEWLEKAAEVPAPTADEGRALLYDLAVALEDAGEVSRALAVLLELQSEVGDYRDAGARAARLARVQAGG